MSSSASAAPSSPSVNLNNIEGLSPWGLLENYYARLGAVDKHDYFPNVSQFIFAAFLFPDWVFRCLLWLNVFRPSMMVVPFWIMR
jgi:hypothetical protein